MDSVHNLGERPRVEVDDVILLDIGTWSVSRFRPLVGVAVPLHVGVERLPCDLVFLDAP